VPQVNPLPSPPLHRCYRLLDDISGELLMPINQQRLHPQWRVNIFQGKRRKSKEEKKGKKKIVGPYVTAS